ncbi:MAG: hypothetical protein HKP55_06220 [Gammaproteobacteria bacterium]|nr:hypothetical protein [Gammaproteobacteria bacterium]
MNIIKTLLIAPLAVLVAMPVYADRYENNGHSQFDKRVERQESRLRKEVKNHDLTRKKAFNKSYRVRQYDLHKGHRGKSQKYNRGHHYGWHKKPYGLYKKHYSWHRRPYGYHDHGYRSFDNDGWSLILRLSDDF